MVLYCYMYCFAHNTECPWCRLNEGVRITDFYRFDEVLGEGTFSTVYLAESRVEPDGWVAVKVSGVITVSLK